MTQRSCRVVAALFTMLFGSAAVASATNIVLNPNFSLGNVDIASDYAFVAPTPTACLPGAIYTIITSPADCHSQFDDFGDHTTGTGNMMVVNGAGAPDVTVWQQSGAVLPNTHYFFSVWGASVNPFSPAQLNFSINGAAIGGVINFASTTGLWQQFYVEWDSGANTSALLRLVNQNTALSGNDFALDDFAMDTVLVPEPASMALVALGLAGLALRRRRTS